MTRATVPFDQSGRFLPLRLCEVLEREFVNIHGHPGSAPSWQLGPGDIAYPKLLELLQFPSQSASAPAIVAIKEKLAGMGVPNPGEGPWDNTLEPELLKSLNAALLAHEALFDHHLLEDDSEAWRVAEALARQRKPSRASSRPSTQQGTEPEQARSDVSAAEHGAPDDHVQRNRLLLEAAFPASAVARVDTVRLNRLFRNIHGLSGPESIYSALCLSGGGIRSAAFALGVLQALARCGVLEKFDYLSTVSGGGYIGSWLSTWIHRHPNGLAGVMTELGTHALPEAGGLPRKLRPESGALRFLRSYSHFLNPKGGLFSADTWSWIGIYLRNLLLNWLVLIPLLLLLVALPRLYSALLYNSEFAHGDFFPWLVWIATLAIILTLVCVTVNRPSISDTVIPPRKWVGGAVARVTRPLLDRFKHQKAILALGILPAVVFAILLTLVVWGFPESKEPLRRSPIWGLLSQTSLLDLPALVPYIGMLHIIVWGELIVLVGWLIATMLLPRRDWRKRFEELLAMLAAGVLTWGLIAMLADYASRISTSTLVAFHIGSITAAPAHAYAVFAVPAIVTAILVGMTLFIGWVSKFKWIEDEDREWWARFGAWILIVMVAWAALAAITLFGPPLLLEFPKLVASVGGVSGLMAVLLGKSSLATASGQPSASTPSRAGNLLKGVGLNTLATAALVFFVVFLAFLSLLASAALEALLKSLHARLPAGDASTGMLADLLRPTRDFSHACGLGEPWPVWWSSNVFRDPQLHLEITCQTPLGLILAVALGLTAILVVSSRLINLNKFSLHAAYRIRIVRTFLGASRRSDRRPNPFTGFDPLDNVQMHELQPGLLREADVLNLPGFVEKFRQALLGKGDQPTEFLVGQMCTPQRDPAGVLESRLRHSVPDKPVLKAVQRDLLESLNRILETIRLDQAGPFKLVDEGGAQKVKRFIEHNNVIFANRLLLETAFTKDIKPYDFPPPPPHKLIHILNLTLNLVRGRKLAWQERKAAPFAVTPMHSGSYYLGYRESREYGGKDGISIGTATAISGAAVSPNMGYSSSPVTALLLTLFNVRLGWWLGNPGIAGNDTYTRAEPLFSLRPLLSEALGLTDDQSPYIYLSDGGHFENLGLFEVVLRRCRLIVASDAGADPKYEFEDLGNAVRKIRIDLGIPIEFSSIAMRKRSEKVDESGRYCALGRIRYSVIDGDDAPDGVLIWLKPAIYGKEPQDVLNYAAQKAAFPQEPTSDQFFGESQFESYRQLGEFEAQIVCGGAEDSSAGKSWARVLVTRVREYLGLDREPWLDRWLDTLPDASPGNIELADRGEAVPK